MIEVEEILKCQLTVLASIYLLVLSLKPPADELHHRDHTEDCLYRVLDWVYRFYSQDVSVQASED